MPLKTSTSLRYAMPVGKNHYSFKYDTKLFICKLTISETHIITIH